MKISELFKSKNKNSNEYYYQYLRKPETKSKFAFLKSKSFILIISLAFVIASTIIILRFSTSRKIQKLIYNQEFDRAILIARTYLKNNKNEKVTFLLAESLFIKSFYIKNESEIEKLRDESQKLLNSAIKKNANISSIELFTYGFLLSRDNSDMDKGVDYLKDAIKKNQKDGKLGAYINRRIIRVNNKPLRFVDIYERIALTLFKLKRYRESLDYYKSALKTRPKTIHYFFMGLINKHLKNYKKARQLLNLVLKTEKNEDVRANCYLLLANIEFKQENFQKAEEFYKKTLELNSQSANSYYFLGKIYRKQKKLKKYREYLKEAAKLGHKKAKTMFPSYELKKMRKQQVYRKVK